MKKETLTVYAESRQVKDAILKDFNESQQEAAMRTLFDPSTSRILPDHVVNHSEPTSA
jgi:hypothetical protein